MPVLYRRGLLESTRVTMIAPEYISPNPDQPRRYFDPDGLSELADSIRAHGILQPLSVRRHQRDVSWCVQVRRHPH